MSDPMPVQTMPWWKKPESGKWGHMAITFGGGLLLVLIPVLIDNLHGSDPLIKVSESTLVILTAALNYVYSQLRNSDAVLLSSDEGAWVKGVQAGGGAAVLATAKDVVPNTESVIILRDNPSTKPDATTPPPGHEWEGFREAHRTPLSDRLADLPEREPPRRPPG